MPTLFVEIGKAGRLVTTHSQSPMPIHRVDMLKSATLPITGSASSPTALALTEQEIRAGYEVARVSADVDCYFAAGGANPDPTTSPRRVLFAKDTVTVQVGPGDEFSVISLT